MLDLSHIPNSQQDVRIFYTNGSTNAWQTWTKPKKCNYVWIMCIGGGGGGSGGQNTNNTSHGTGGASGGVARSLFNAQQLPDTLYVQVGTGGAGGAAITNGSAGTRSFVSLTPVIGVATSIAGSGTAGAAGGNLAANATGEPAPGQANINFLCLANFSNTSGVTAVNIGDLPAPNITPLTSQITCPGGGGPGYNTGGTPVAYNGASILSSSISPLIPGGAGTIASGSNGGRGADGITSWKPFFSTGGAGGGAAVSGSGGNGGNGGIGSGGGGGGAGNIFLGYAGGRGGRGGDGLVVIISF